MTRAQARAAGLSRYNTGKPCKQGHVADRYVSCKACTVCHHIGKERRMADPAVRARYEDRAQVQRSAPEVRERRRGYSRNHRRRAYANYPRELFEQRLSEQHNACAICGDETFGGRTPNADHCHVTQSPRGVLCSKCNTLLGKAEDNIDILLNAVDYLQKWEALCR